MKRTRENYDRIGIPKPTEELMKMLEKDVKFDFLKSLEIENINKEILALHPLSVDNVNVQEYVPKKAEMAAKSAGGPIEGLVGY